MMRNTINNLLIDLFRKHSIFLIFLVLSISIPFFISLIVFFIQPFSVHLHFVVILLLFTCSIPAMFFSLPFHNNLIFLIIMIMLIHLLFIFFYSFLYKRNEKVGMIFEIVSIVINILMGLAVLSAIGSV